MAGRIRSHDWTATPLGAISEWSPMLRAAVDQMLAMPTVATVVWGPERSLLYNDQAIGLYGDRHPAALGRPLDAMSAGVDPAAGEDYDRAYAGESRVMPAQVLAAANPADTAPRVFDAHLVPLRNERGEVAGVQTVAFEVGERMRLAAERDRYAVVPAERERRAAFLLQLSDALRTVIEPEQIQAITAQLLGEHLRVDRCGFALIDPLSGDVDVAHAFERPGVRPIPRHHTLDGYGAAFAEILRGGELLVIGDISTDPRAADPSIQAAFAGVGLAASISAPLVASGRLSGLMFVHQSHAREWEPAEIALIKDVAERTWDPLQNAARQRAPTEIATGREAARASEERYQALFAASPVPFMVLTPNAPDFTITAANAAYFAASKTTRESLIGRRLFDVFPDDPNRPGQLGSEALAASLDRVLATRTTDAMERVRYDLSLPDGGFEPHWWEAINAPMLTASGEVSAIIHQVTRVTELHHAEEARRQERERQAFQLRLSDALRNEPDPDALAQRALRMLFEQMGLDRCYIGIYRLEEDRGEFPHQLHDDALPPLPSHVRLSDFPKALEVASGSTLVIDDIAQTAGLSGADRINLEALGMRAIVTATLRKGAGTPLWGIVAGSARPRAWTRSEISLVEDAAERIWAAVERARTEAALRTSEEQFESLLNQAPLGVYLVDGDFVIAQVNPIALPVFGDLPGGPIGRDFDEVIHILWAREYADEVVDIFRRTLETGESHVEPERAEHRADLGITQYYEWRIDRIRLSSDRFGVVCYFRDISTFVRAREEAKEGRAIARESEQRQAFLLKLSDAVRPLVDPEAIGREATRVLAEHLGATRCEYWELQPENEHFEAAPGYTRDDIPNQQRHRSGAFGTRVRDILSSGRTLAIADVHADPSLDAIARRAFADMDTAATVCVPLVKQGKLTAVLALNHATPHAWTRVEVAMVEEAADRIWAAVERARAEAALFAEEARYRALFESIDQGFCVLEMIHDAAGRPVDFIYREVNGAFARHSGIDDAAGHHVREFEPDLAEFWLETYDRVRRTGVSERFENSVVELARTYDVFAFRVPDSSPPLVGVLFKDITARQLAVSRLAESEERLGLALKASGLASWDWNIVTDEVTWSDEHYRMQGYEVGEVQPSFEAWAARVHPDDLPAAIAALNTARDGRTEYLHEMRGLLPDGEVRVLCARGIFFYDTDGRAVRMIGVMEDVTHARRASAALREREAHFQAFADASTDVLWMRNAADLDIVFISKAFESMYGMPVDEVRDEQGFRDWMARVLPEDRAGVLQAIRRVRSGEDVVHEFRIRHADGSVRNIRNTDFPLLAADGHIEMVGGIAQDVTVEREYSGRLQLLMDELQHRTRNLIAVIRSLARRTAVESDTLPGFAACFDDRLSAIARVQGLLSRLGTGQKVTFDELLDVELKAHGAQAGRVELHGPVGVRLRSSTVQTFALALHELATNATKYGALGTEGGRLTVEWKVVADGGSQAELHVDWRESGVVMAAPGAPPRGGGYGRELIERALPYQLKAKTSYSLGPDGVHCTIQVPIPPPAA